VIDDESLVKTRTNICLSYASVPSYSVPKPRISPKPSMAMTGKNAVVHGDPLRQFSPIL
jgi:hypothetical protein